MIYDVNNTVSFHPNPIAERENFVSLNGEWDFGYSTKYKKHYKFSSDATKAAAVREKGEYSTKINLPFAIESVLSGIGYTAFLNEVWYKKTVDIKKGEGRVFLNIGAADNLTTVLVNGKLAGRHKGGYTSFRFDITELVEDGENEIFIYCEDNVKDPTVISGKQSEKLQSHGCHYTRTTGIWQTVYLEFTPQNYVKSFKVYPDLANGALTVNASLFGKGDLDLTAYYDGKEVGKTSLKNVSSNALATVKLEEIHPWEVGDGKLYDLKIEFAGDEVKSYFGLRNVSLDGYKFIFNGRSLFQRTVLDQGFYKKGIYTAQNDEEIKLDIELSMGVGFNGARLHQKVFDPRFLYFADKMGYLVWGEYANWGVDVSDPKSVDLFLKEWSEAVERDFNHPAIIGWCPFNETWDYCGRRQYDPLLATVYEYTKAVDSSRPCIDTSGNYHVETDIYDLHDYNQNHKEFKEHFDRLPAENFLYEEVLVGSPGRQRYDGKAPVFISEYGGIKWTGDPTNKDAWGYGVEVKSVEEFVERYCGLTSAIVENERMMGFCYTQLYDVEQEQNGLFTYERKKKFDDEVYEKIRKCNTAIAGIEIKK